MLLIKLQLRPTPGRGCWTESDDEQLNIFIEPKYFPRCGRRRGRRRARWPARSGCRRSCRRTPGAGRPSSPWTRPTRPPHHGTKTWQVGLKQRGPFQRGILLTTWFKPFDFCVLLSTVCLVSGCPCEAHAAICHGLSSVLCNVSIITPA